MAGAKQVEGRTAGIGLVGGDEEARRIAGVEKLEFVRTRFTGGVEEEQDNVGLGGLVVGACDGFFFEGVGRLAHAGGVDEEDGDVDVAMGEGGEGVDPVACGARDVGGDGDRTAEEGVGEGGFSGIGGADDSEAWGMEKFGKGDGALEEPLGGGVELPEVVSVIFFEP